MSEAAGFGVEYPGKLETALQIADAAPLVSGCCCTLHVGCHLFVLA